MIRRLMEDISKGLWTDLINKSLRDLSDESFTVRQMLL